MDPEEENFEEAVKFAYRAYDLPTLDHFTESVLNDARAQNLTKDSPSFWILCQAVKRFIKNEGHGFLIPCSNNLPDLVSETVAYLEFRTIFRDRAQKDQDAVWAHVQAILKEVGLPAEAVSHAEAEFFVKNVRGIRCCNYRALAQEYNPSTFNKENVTEILEEYVVPDPDAEIEVPRPVHWYFALRAADAFQQKFKRYPGVGGDPSRDAEQLYELQTELVQAVGLTDMETKPDCLQEIARWGATEIHNIAAFVGGVGAQATLKVVLQQYVPLNNTLIFNGISGGCQAMEL
jgi:amyloid beta precursor protein binding protein 1